MLISYNWLKKYIKDLDSIKKSDLADSITSKLAEVEQIIPIRQDLKNVFCGEIKHIEPIKNSDKLTYCTVDIGDKGEKYIVCGAPNVKVNKKVAVVLEGGQVYSENGLLNIERKKLLNKLSEGMLCSEIELGLGNDGSGILILEDQLENGTELVPILSDTVFEIENKSLTHRPDCFSHFGIAREIAAMYDLKLYEEEFNSKTLSPILSNKPFKLDIAIKTPKNNLCERFTAICLTDIEIKPSPLWIKSLLTALGERPKNNIVDISNYIMFDVGQPLHIYDYDKLKKKSIVVRLAKTNEKIETISGKTFELKSDNLLITDGTNPLGIAGIMGGIETEVTDTTKSIVIEAANFDMFSIRKTSRQLGLRSEASTRFEKGLDVELTKPALIKTVELIEDLTNCEIASEIIDINNHESSEKIISLDLSLVARFLGIQITTRDIIDYLDRLNLKVLEPEKITNLNTQPELNLTVDVSIPSYRKDLNMEYDLLEEIARIYGYQNFPKTLPEVPVKASYPNKFILTKRTVSRVLSACGFDEIKTYSFVKKEQYDQLGLNIKNCLKIKNPLNADCTHIQDTLLPNIIETIKTNYKKYPEFKVFTQERVVSKALQADKLHIQPFHVAGLTYSKNSNMEYFNIKGSVEQIFKYLNIDVDYSKISSNHEYVNLFHVGRTAIIKYNNQEIGIIGELNPGILINENIKGRAAVFEMDLEKLHELAKFDCVFKELSIYQETVRDLTFWLDNNIDYSNVIEAINHIDDIVKEIKFNSIYFDEKKVNKKSISISIYMQSEYETLTVDQINTVINKIISKLEKDFKAEIVAS